MSSNFNYFNNKSRRVAKSKYSFPYKLVCDANMGEIIPLQIFDVLPGDELTLNPEIILKTAPMVAPTTTEIRQNLRLFYVPFRLLYSKFNDMYMGTTADALVVPQVQFSSAAEFQAFYRNYGRLYNYFGLPQDDGIYSGAPANYPSSLSLLPLRAYQNIYYHYYLDWRKQSQSQMDLYKAQMCKNDSGNLTVSALLANEAGVS